MCCSNVLLSKNGDVKLCDFGISGKMVQSMAKTRAIGCALYMPVKKIVFKVYFKNRSEITG